MSVRSIGVEEELLLVAPETGQPRAVAGTVLQALQQEAALSGDGPDGRAGGHEAVDALESELQQQQLETNTRPCRSINDLGRELRRCRSWAASAAQRAGVQVAALATSPVPVEPTIMGNERYQEIADEFGLTAQEQLTCGCHVHVEISSDEEGVAALDRIQPWLPVLLALSAELAVLAGTRQRLRELPLPGVGALADFGTDRDVRHRRELPQHGSADDAHGHGAGHRDGVLRRPPVRALPDA
jgi:glutamate---cysteine ligase / carboxylate-amine ligase